MLYHIAHETGIGTVEELRTRMLAEEFLGWYAYFQITHEREKAALDKAKSEAKSSSRRR